MNEFTRRKYLAATAATTICSALPSYAASDTEQRIPHIATNTYPWLTFARRNDQPFERHTDELLRRIASTGITGYEPIVDSVSEFNGLQKRLENHSLQMRSLYVNSTLHDEAKVEGSIENVLAIAKTAITMGTKIFVTNPSPIRWGGPEDKTDQELRIQAKALNRLGNELRQMGVTLAYHNHDAELRQGGREFHHMLTATDPDNVKLCLDAHWIFRGCGDSQVAVFDALAHYHSRVVELHLRQSNRGAWREDFRMQGDIDYARLYRFLRNVGIQPHLVLEQAVEEKSPQQLTVVDAHRRGCQHLAEFLNG